jgi:hypothetical protein
VWRPRRTAFDPRAPCLFLAPLVQAARYQMVIMFLIAATTGLGSVASIVMAIATVIDPCHRIRPERLIAKSSRSAAFADRVEKWTVEVRGGGGVLCVCVFLQEVEEQIGCCSGASVQGGNARN